MLDPAFPHAWRALPPPAVQAGAFYRWRMAWATVKRFASLAILDPATGAAADCELLLLAKDGHWLMQASAAAGRGPAAGGRAHPHVALPCVTPPLTRPASPGPGLGPIPSGCPLANFAPNAPTQQVPRAVDHMYFAPGNRAELLVRCSGAPGSQYVLTAQVRAGRGRGASKAALLQPPPPPPRALAVWLGGPWGPCGWWALLCCNGTRPGYLQPPGLLPLLALASMQAPASSPFQCDLGGTPNAFVQDTLATIDITQEVCLLSASGAVSSLGCVQARIVAFTILGASRGVVSSVTDPSRVFQLQVTAQAAPKLKACTPARAGYAADLRDPALVAAGAGGKLLAQDVTFTMMGQPYSCMVNGQVRQGRAAPEDRPRL